MGETQTDSDNGNKIVSPYHHPSVPPRPGSPWLPLSFSLSPFLPPSIPPSLSPAIVPTTNVPRNWGKMSDTTCLSRTPTCRSPSDLISVIIQRGDDDDDDGGGGGDERCPGRANGAIVIAQYNGSQFSWVEVAADGGRERRGTGPAAEMSRFDLAARQSETRPVR